MPRILLVDDDAVIIKLYQIILKGTEFELEIAPTGKDMLLAIGKQKPDVILLDVVLPDSSGLDLCSKIKNDPTFTGTKIILVSGQEISPVQIAQGIEMGADDYLVKPFHPKELLARVKNCLKLKTIEEALRDKNKELKDLSNHLQHVREEERKMLAYEVQEELGQLTAALKMDIDWMAKSLSGAPEEVKERMLNASATSKLIISNVRKIACFTGMALQKNKRCKWDPLCF
jgi:DNA-binding response OmpR family regulator